MISHEAYLQFIRDVQEQIDERDRAIKQKAETTLKAISDSYRQRVYERISCELSQVDECRKVGDNMAAKHHAMLAEIYKSLLNLDK